MINTNFVFDDFEISLTTALRCSPRHCEAIREPEKK